MIHGSRKFHNSTCAFLIKEGETWNFFFEVYNNDTQQDDRSVATSKNTWIWNYEKVIIDEPSHLAYPYVLKSDGEYYLIPESFESNSIRFYKVDGRDYVDNSIVYYRGKWWLFSSVTSNDQLSLHHANSLMGPWNEHPQSPIVRKEVDKARPSGRLLVYEDKLYHFAVDVKPAVGPYQVRTYEITNISLYNYSEQLAQKGQVIWASGVSWKH